MSHLGGAFCLGGVLTYKRNLNGHKLASYPLNQWLGINVRHFGNVLFSRFELDNRNLGSRLSDRTYGRIKSTK